MLNREGGVVEGEGVLVVEPRNKGGNFSHNNNNNIGVGGTSLLLLNSIGKVGGSSTYKKTTSLSLY